ncbi:protein kinase C delta type-like [Eleutherodactylus coqui]|uniref:protein kinase C delta type-like n=1 Tax=Eleutherodactylus coqui TaxID=57060 RepID=UPI003463435B
MVLLAEDPSTRKHFAVKIVGKRALLTLGGDYVTVERRVLQMASGSPFLVHADFALQTKVLARKAYNAGVDWYSFGVILRKMVTNHSNDDQRLDASSGIYNLIKQLLKKDPTRRLGVNGTIRTHQFFRCLDWVAVEALEVTPPFTPEPSEPRHSPKAFNLAKLEAKEVKGSSSRGPGLV